MAVIQRAYVDGLQAEVWAEVGEIYMLIAIEKRDETTGTYEYVQVARDAALEWAEELVRMLKEGPSNG